MPPALHAELSDTEVESLEAESQWRTLFRKLRGEMTPELQAQHHSRISKRELTKEFDGLIEEMEVDKMYLHLCCGTTDPKLVDAHRETLNSFARARNESGSGCAWESASDRRCCQCLLTGKESLQCLSR